MIDSQSKRKKNKRDPIKIKATEGKTFAEVMKDINIKAAKEGIEIESLDKVWDESAKIKTARTDTEKKDAF